MAAGQCVVADKGYSVRRKEFAAQCKQALAHRLGNPGIKPMRDDVVELAKFRTNIEQIALKDARVCKAEFANALLSALYRQAGQVESDELAAWNRIGHGNEVCTLIACDLEDTALLDGCRREAVQNRHRGETIGVCIRIRKAGIGNCIVRILLAGHLQAPFTKAVIDQVSLLKAHEACLRVS